MAGGVDRSMARSPVTGVTQAGPWTIGGSQDGRRLKAGPWMAGGSQAGPWMAGGSQAGPLMAAGAVGGSVVTW